MDLITRSARETRNLRDGCSLINGHGSSLPGTSWAEVSAEEVEASPPSRIPSLKEEILKLAWESQL